MKTTQRMVGKRLKSANKDFYPTPDIAVEKLLDKEDFCGEIWEPACGKGNISLFLKKKGLQVYSSDLYQTGFGDNGIDFLKTTRTVQCVVTNPPFSLALEFVEHAKKQAEEKIALLLRLNFLEGQKRKLMFEDTTFPLKRVLVFSKRISLCENEIKKQNGIICFSWFIWSKSHKGSPTLDWI